MNTTTNARNATVNASAKTAKPARRNTNMAGVSLLITTASFMATLTGWAVFANKDYTPVATSSPTVEAPIVTNYVAQALPTIEPLIGVDTTNQVAQVSTTTKAPVAATTTTIVKHVTTAIAAAPRAVTTTRSSR